MKISSQHAAVTISESRLRSIIALFDHVKIAVVGDVGIDRYTQGSVDRISPEAPVPIVLVEKEYLKLGLAANVADNIVALGGAPYLVGVVGSDKDAQDLRDLFEKSEIASRGLVIDKTRRTILKERILGGTQQILRVDYEDSKPLPAEIRKKLSVAALKSLQHTHALIIEDYAKGLFSRELIAETIAGAKAKKIPVIVDPHLKTPIEWYAGVTCLTPNKKEAETLARVKIVDEASLIKAGRFIISKTNAKSLVITLGAEGVAIFENGRAKPVLIPTFAKEVYDVSGAGDTVIAVLALTLAGGATLEEAAYVANLAAGVEVSKRGTATVSREEIIRAYLSRNH
jgi:rfaE bifunctional protein kinase chain/domain